MKAVIIFIISLLSFLITGVNKKDKLQKIEGQYIHTFSTVHLGWEFILHIKGKNKYTETIKTSSIINGKLKKESHKIKGEWAFDDGKIILTPTRCRGDKTYCISDTLIINRNQLKKTNGTGIYRKE